MKLRLVSGPFFAGALALLLSLEASAQNTPDTAPVITVQPASSVVTAGSGATFTVTATGSPSPAYQWLRNGRPIPGATADTYTIASTRIADANAYSVRVSNRAGRVISADATLDVTAQPGVVTARPVSQVVNAGSDVTFSVATTGPGLTYQWRFNGRALSNATDPNLTLTNVGNQRDGTYTVVVSAGGVVSEVDAAVLTVNSDARLTNLSTRGFVGVDDRRLIIGFVLSGTGNKRILLRGVGPTLGTQFGVSGALAQPELALLGFGKDGKTDATNHGWGGDPALAATFAEVGAFPLPADSADSALLETLQGGWFTAHVTGGGGATGIALAELYDADPTIGSPSLVNISARAYVGTGDAALIAGFVVTGTTSESLLIRGVGPSLRSRFGLRGALAATHVTVTDVHGNAIMADDDWNDDPDVSDTCDRVGAFGLEEHSHDSALLATLKPGAYTVVVTGRAGATGLAMAEIYEVR